MRNNSFIRHHTNIPTRDIKHVHSGIDKDREVYHLAFLSSWRAVEGCSWPSPHWQPNNIGTNKMDTGCFLWSAVVKEATTGPPAGKILSKSHVPCAHWIWICSSPPFGYTIIDWVKSHSEACTREILIYRTQRVSRILQKSAGFLLRSALP